jgi:hypothetical protein
MRQRFVIFPRLVGSLAQHVLLVPRYSCVPQTRTRFRLPPLAPCHRSSHSSGRRRLEYRRRRHGRCATSLCHKYILYLYLYLYLNGERTDGGAALFTSLAQTRTRSSLPPLAPCHR